jgi:hypothetical protein
MLGNSIGISIGTRSIGVAIFNKGDLEEWQIKSFKKRMSTEKLYKISDSVLKFIRDYECTEVVFKMPNKCKTHTNVSLLKEYLVKTLTEYNYSIYFYSISEIKASVGVPIKNKAKLLEWGVKTYKELSKTYKQEQKIKHGYHVKLFEAVAALHVHIHR